MTVTDFAAVPMLRLAVDGEDHIEEEGPMGTTWRAEYKEVMSTELFLSASGYEALTGEPVDLAGGESRYDGELRPHSHVRCRLCGTVADLPAVEVDRPLEDGGFLLEDCAVVYRGLCPACRRSGEN